MMTDQLDTLERIAVAGDRPPIDFQAVFECLPSPYMVLDRNLAYVSVNAAYCHVLERSRDDLIGRNLFDAFPNQGPEVDRLRESFERVFATGRQDVIPLIPYPIQAPASRGGGLEMRYWSAVHVPLFDAEGRVAYVMQNTVDVTELQRLKQIAFGPEAEPKPGEPDLLQRALKVEELNRSLAEESRGLRELFMQAPGFMAVLTGPDLIFTLVNKAYLQLIGHRQVIGKRLLDALPEIAGQGFDTLLEEVRRSGQPYIGSALSVYLQRTPDGLLEERFVDFIYQPITNADGAVFGVFVEGSDVTDRVLGERQQRLLLDELNHRVKNSLATVQAITAQTIKSASSLDEFRVAFESRLMALSGNHDLLTATNWRSASLRDVLAREFKPYESDRFSLQGPDVQLPPAKALAMGMLIHELATNAAKYGALSGAKGCVHVRWSVEGDLMRFQWFEEDGPPVAPPVRRGFGTRLITRSLEGALGGTTDLRLEPTGAVCRVTLPLAG